MMNHIWKKISFYLGFLPLGAIFGLTMFLTTLEVKDLDLWLHLAVGKFITEHGFVPSVDILSCSIAGQPWGNHEWFFQVVIYNIFNQWGFDGLLTMQSVIATAAMVLLFFIGYSKEKQGIISVCLLLVMLVFQQRFTIRPDLFSLLFFSIYIFVLSVHIDKKWAGILLFIIQILWVNMHGFFFFGPLFVLIGLGSEWLKRNVKLPYEWNESGRLADSEYRRLGEIFILVVIACFLNPGFIKGAWYPLGVFFNISGDHKVFFDYIQELQKPIPTWSALFDADRWGPYKLLILLSGVSFILNRRKIDISALLFWVIFLVFSLKALRNASYFAFAAYLVILNNVYALDMRRILPIRFTAIRFQYVTAIVFKIALIMWIFGFARDVSTAGYYDFDKYERKSEYGGVTQRNYPDKAVDFLVANNISGNFFNDFNSGAYLIGRKFPDIKVFIDGRTEVYGPRFFNQYRQILSEGDDKLFTEMVNKYQITGILLNSATTVIPEKFLKYISTQSDWVPVYFNYDGIVFLRNVPKNKAVIDQFAIDLAHWDAKQLDIYRLGPTVVTPYRPYYRAYSLASMEFDEPALKEAQFALDIDPTYNPPYELMGKIYAKKKDFEKAFYYFRIATMLSPGKKETRNNLALAYSDLGKFDLAIKQYERIKESWPEDPRVHIFIAKTYARQNKLEEMFTSLDQGLKQNPFTANDVNMIADVFVEQSDYDHAIKVYDRALAVAPKQANLYLDLSGVYTKMKDPQKARETLEKGAGVLPENEDIKKQLKELTDKV